MRMKKATTANTNGETILYHFLQPKTSYRQTFKLAKSRMLRLIHLDAVQERLSPSALQP
jgi:hypothetical protein